MKAIQLEIKFPTETKKKVAKPVIVNTPLMQQYYAIKAQYPDAILLFRCGEFYELYLQDAIRGSEILNTTLSYRRNSKGENLYEFTGFPFYSLDTYLPKLVRAGLRVAICDSINKDKKKTKTTRKK